MGHRGLTTSQNRRGGGVRQNKMEENDQKFNLQQKGKMSLNENEKNEVIITLRLGRINKVNCTLQLALGVIITSIVHQEPMVVISMGPHPPLKSRVIGAPHFYCTRTKKFLPYLPIQSSFHIVVL